MNYLPTYPTQVLTAVRTCHCKDGRCTCKRRELPLLVCGRCHRYVPHRYLGTASSKAPGVAGSPAGWPMLFRCTQCGQVRRFGWANREEVVAPC